MVPVLANAPLCRFLSRAFYSSNNSAVSLKRGCIRLCCYPQLMAVFTPPTRTETKALYCCGLGCQQNGFWPLKRESISLLVEAIFRTFSLLHLLSDSSVWRGNGAVTLHQTPLEKARNFTSSKMGAVYRCFDWLLSALMCFMWKHSFYHQCGDFSKSDSAHRVSKSTNFAAVAAD